MSETFSAAEPTPTLPWYRRMLRDGIPRRSFYAALVVGTALNLINQGDALVVGGGIDWLKALMTYSVPYMVSTYGAVTATGARARKR